MFLFIHDRSLYGLMILWGTCKSTMCNKMFLKVILNYFQWNIDRDLQLERIKIIDFF